MENIKKIIRYIIIPLYFIPSLFGLYYSQIPLFPDRGIVIPIGLILNYCLISIGMWAFVKRKLKPGNYLIALIILLFYFLLFWTDAFTFIAHLLFLPDKWVLYGLLYTLFILIFGIRFIIRKRNDQYQVIRTISLMIVQLILAFILPLVLKVLINKEYYFSYLWPLKIEYFYPSVILEFPFPFIIYSFAVSLILVPFLALFTGKRFYCSWICGCGGLAETFGDQWRHLSDKSASAWKFEKISIHSVLIFAVVTTLIILINHGVNGEDPLAFPLLGVISDRVKDIYEFNVSTILAGIVGVGFYPTLGSRVWCRFFCPMAALLGLIQKQGRFQISVKPDMCISCGNCSTYCEQGIDVRLYAQENRSFTRASCVGCGICAHVCPRGVLRLDNRKKQ
ncbi:MAG: 4Fe-4S binding protein [Spirochaetales bacterium]|nr:4Fe-4S binding protein [Spirochaetales bacterium]